VTAKNDAQAADRDGKAEYGNLGHGPDARRGDTCRREKPKGFGRIARDKGAIASTLPAGLPPGLERLLFAELLNEDRARSCPGGLENAVDDETGANGKGADEEKRNPGRQQRLRAWKQDLRKERAAGCQHDEQSCPMADASDEIREPPDRERKIPADGIKEPSRDCKIPLRKDREHKAGYGCDRYCAQDPSAPHSPALLECD
jgi:hypothetical protein